MVEQILMPEEPEIPDMGPLFEGAHRIGERIENVDKFSELQEKSIEAATHFSKKAEPLESFEQPLSISIEIITDGVNLVQSLLALGSDTTKWATFNTKYQALQDKFESQLQNFKEMEIL